MVQLRSILIVPCNQQRHTKRSRHDAFLSIRTLSSRPDMVSGGDALVEIRGATKGVTLTLNGRDVSGDLKLDPASHSLRGLVGGLTLGKNTLAATAGAAKATLAVTNYPITGPILSGAHITPYECRTEESGRMGPLSICGMTGG